MDDKEHMQALSKNLSISHSNDQTSLKPIRPLFIPQEEKWKEKTKFNSVHIIFINSIIFLQFANSYIRDNEAYGLSFKVHLH